MRIHAFLVGTGMKVGEVARLKMEFILKETCVRVGQCSYSFDWASEKFL